MIYEGCQSTAKEISLEIKTCPNCGHEVEIFSVDTSIDCENCGFTVYNDMLSCVQWCQYARKCVGDEMYERTMEVARLQKERYEAEKKAKKSPNPSIQKD